MTEHKHDDARGASTSDAELGWTLYDNLDPSGHPLACAVRDNAKAEMLRLRYLIDIAYDHLLNCGYRDEDPTLTQLRAGLSESGIGATELARRAWEHQQAEIDGLMLEYCPDEMTAEQIANWERHQQAVPNA